MSALNQGNAIFEDMTPEVGLGRVVKAAWDNAGLTSTVESSVVSSIERGGLSNIGQKQSPEKLNKMFPGLNADRDITISEAEYIMNKREQVQENQKVINLASESFLKGTVAPFVAGAARAMTDPVDLGIGFLTGGIGSGLTKGASVARKVAIDAAEAATAATIAEVPIMREANQTFEEYTATQFAQNVLMASAMQVGITYGGSAALKSSAKSIEFMGNKTADGMLKLADRLEASGVNPSPVLEKVIGNFKKMFENVEPINMSIKNNIPNVKIGDDLSETLNNVKKAFEDGEIDEDALIKFREEAIESGVDERVFQKAVDKESVFEHNDLEIEEIKKIIESEDSKTDFNPQAREVESEMNSFNPEEFSIENLDSFERSLEAIEEAEMEVSLEGVEGFEGKTLSIKSIKEDLQKGRAEQDIFKEFAACKRGEA